MTLGSGQRGDMQAVIAAILLDTEARRGDSAATANPGDGHLREPVLFIANILRAFGASSDGAAPASSASSMSEAVMDSPSVFNFFPPDYNIPGTNLLGPEFDLQTTATTLVRYNFVNSFVYGSIGAGTTVDFTSYASLARESERHRPIARFAKCVTAPQRYDVRRARQHPRGSERRSGRIHAKSFESRGRDLFDSFVVAISGRAVANSKEGSMKITRRDLIRQSCCAAAAFGMATSFSRFGLMQALAQSPANYQALVCIFLFGGNDANNMLIPTDTAGYANYLKYRVAIA